MQLREKSNISGECDLKIETLSVQGKHIDGNMLNLTSTRGNVSFENNEILHPDEYILQKMVPKCKRHVQESI